MRIREVRPPGPGTVHQILAAQLDIDPAVPLIVWDGTDVDSTTALVSYVVARGRGDVTRTTEPSTCTVGLDSRRTDYTPRVGDQLPLRIHPEYAAALEVDPARFTGRVTDVALADDNTITVTATGTSARLTSRVGAEPWPAELDGARAARILAALATIQPVDVGTIEPGTVRVLARDVDAQPAGALLDELAVSAYGLLIEGRDGALSWHDANHRRDATPVVELGGDAIMRPFAWTQGIGDLVNSVTVTYGTGAAVTITDPASADPVTGHGLAAGEIRSVLAAQVDAATLAFRMVARRAVPLWRLPAVTVDLMRTARAQLPHLLEIETGDLVDLTGLPGRGPGTEALAWVEGMTESMTRTAWRTSLALSDYLSGGVNLRWVDVPAGIAWDDVAAGLTWLDSARITDPTDLT